MSASAGVVDVVAGVVATGVGVDTGAGAAGVATPAGVGGAGVEEAPPKENPPVVDAPVGVVVAVEVALAPAVVFEASTGAGAPNEKPPDFFSSFLSAAGVGSAAPKLNDGAAGVEAPPKLKEGAAAGAAAGLLSSF